LKRPSRAGVVGSIWHYAHGNGWTVWVGLPGNPPVQQAPLGAALAVPTFKAGTDIDVPDEWLN